VAVAAPFPEAAATTAEPQKTPQAGS
jgi:hypothetical protein